MDNRYKNIQKIINNSDTYKQYLQEREIKNLVQYSTFNFNKLKDIDQYGFDTVTHTIEPYERLYNISQKYYGSPEYGWIILYTNKISDETKLKAGDILIVYLPLESVLGLV
jgi:hypothetical protein